MRSRKRQLVTMALCVLSAASTHAADFIVGSNITAGAEVTGISIELACNVEYLSHSPIDHGQRIRIAIDVDSSCSDLPPLIVNLHESFRPVDAETVDLISIEYNAVNESRQYLTLYFGKDVTIKTAPAGVASTVYFEIASEPGSAIPQAETGRISRRVYRAPKPASAYVINISSSQRAHAPSEMPDANDFPGRILFESEVQVAGSTWFRLRLGYFESREQAELVQSQLQEKYPTAWIDQVEKPLAGDTKDLPIGADQLGQSTVPGGSMAALGLDEIDQLMTEARRAMVSGELSKAVQLYTKVLQVVEHDRHSEAQELLAIAREKNGQMAHAKAEYQRFLAQYPNDGRAPRVRQRLASLLAKGRREASGKAAGVPGPSSQERRRSAWRFQTFLSQYYRRDANQLNEEDEIVSQSALYSDINLDARRKGQRFDFGSRISAGYRNDFLSEEQASGNEVRVSYAYADLADSETGLRGRVGRQSRHTGGVLGRFDGLDLGYELNDRVTLNAVAGLPVNSARDGTDSDRVFYGTSIDYRPTLENLELGAFYIQQAIEGIEDRQAVGTELRYFGESVSAWGLVDYDMSFGEISSAFLQGTWRLAARSTLHGSIDRRHSPYLSAGTAIIGQPVEDFAQLLVLLSEEEIRALSKDRSPLSTSYTIGFAHTLSPKIQLNFDANRTTVGATPESGGVAATPESAFEYYSANVIVSSLIKEGDVSMLGLRMSDSDSTKVISATFDTRIPFGARWRINPRLRVDRREIASDGSDELLYTPGLRMQYRHSQKFRMDLEVGRQYSQRETSTIDLNRESYFFNLGYQAFFQ